MTQKVGTISIGIKAPIIRHGDDIVEIVTSSVREGLASLQMPLAHKDIIGVTEAVVARAQNNYATTDQIAKDIQAKLTSDCLAVVFPILSRNRFSIILKAIAKAVKKAVIVLSYPSDEVGNHIISIEELDKHDINPFRDVLLKHEFEELFGKSNHPFTHMDYLGFYQGLCEANGCDAKIILSNNPLEALKYTNYVLACDIHTRYRTKQLLKKAGATVCGLDEILTESIDGSGYNPQYGLLGSNLAGEEKVKLFPRDAQEVVNAIAQKVLAETGVDVEVLIYGDGAFKDPVGKIWELADPVVAPGVTAGLMGQPNELKLKYLADTIFKELSGQALSEAIRDAIQQNKLGEMNEQQKLGTTPRQISDLVGSLCDLTSGSGDKGTPIVVIKNYFDKY